MFKSVQNTSTRTQSTKSTKSTIKSSVGSSQVKTVKQVASTSKSNPLNTSSNHSLTKKSITSKIRSENALKSSDDSMVKKRKSREQVGHSEKRGQSTIYMPRSTASKLNIKSNEKIAHRVSKDKEKLRDSSAIDQTKPRMSSKERRKSRTLSPSEVRMLHSAIKRPDVEKEQKKVSDSQSHTQADSDEANYDYEDDFEVRREKRKETLNKETYMIILVFQDYESDFQECTDSDTSSINEKSDSSGSSTHLEPIELQIREKVLILYLFFRQDT